MAIKPLIQLIRTDPKVEIPKHATLGSAAIDLQAAIPLPLDIYPGENIKIPTGIKLWIEDPNWVGIIVPRSGKGTAGLGLKNLVGVIDSDYQGEITIAAWNTNSEQKLTVEPYERIAQMLFLPVTQVNFIEVAQFTSVTERAEGGFGSTDAIVLQEDLFSEEDNEVKVRNQNAYILGYAAKGGDTNPFQTMSFEYREWQRGFNDAIKMI